MTRWDRQLPVCQTHADARLVHWNVTENKRTHTDCENVITKPSPPSVGSKFTEGMWRVRISHPSAWIVKFNSPRVDCGQVPLIRIPLSYLRYRAALVYPSHQNAPVPAWRKSTTKKELLMMIDAEWSIGTGLMPAFVHFEIHRDCKSL